jgi:hypothetical protein
VSEEPTGLGTTSLGTTSLGTTSLGTTWYGVSQQPEEPMAKHDSVTKRHRRPKSAKREDYTARTMAAVKELEQAAKLKGK